MHKKSILIALFGTILFSGTVFGMNENFQFPKPTGFSRTLTEKAVCNLFDIDGGDPVCLLSIFQRNPFYKKEVETLAFKKFNKSGPKPFPGGGQRCTNSYRTRRIITEQTNRKIQGCFLSAVAEIGGKIKNSYCESDSDYENLIEEDGDVCMEEKNNIKFFQDLFSRDPEKIADDLPMNIYYGETPLNL